MACKVMKTPHVLLFPSLGGAAGEGHTMHGDSMEMERGASANFGAGWVLKLPFGILLD